MKKGELMLSGNNINGFKEGTSAAMNNLEELLAKLSKQEDER